jgi:hypothetical protein
VDPLTVLQVTHNYLLQVHKLEDVVPAHSPTDPPEQVKDEEATLVRSTVEEVDEQVLSKRAAKASQSAREFE